jgi:RimJ/RimL family protein N-acetyltransferase
MTPPTLHTDRLTLRAPGLQDFPAYAAFLQSPRSHIVGGPMDAADAWRSLAAVIGHWTLRGFGRWAVTPRDGGPCIGIVGLHYPESWPEPELGWWLFDGAEGMGYAHEAALAARAYAFHTLGLRTLISLIKASNTRSIALAHRLGAVFEGDFPHPKYGALGVYRHPAPQVLA